MIKRKWTKKFGFRYVLVWYNRDRKKAEQITFATLEEAEKEQDRQRA